MIAMLFTFVCCSDHSIFDGAWVQDLESEDSISTGFGTGKILYFFFNSTPNSTIEVTVGSRTSYLNSTTVSLGISLASSSFYKIKNTGGNTIKGHYWFMNSNQCPFDEPAFLMTTPQSTTFRATPSSLSSDHQICIFQFSTSVPVVRFGPSNSGNGFLYLGTNNAVIPATSIIETGGYNSMLFKYNSSSSMGSFEFSSTGISSNLDFNDCGFSKIHFFTSSSDDVNTLSFSSEIHNCNSNPGGSPIIPDENSILSIFFIFLGIFVIICIVIAAIWYWFCDGFSETMYHSPLSDFESKTESKTPSVISVSSTLPSTPTVHPKVNMDIPTMNVSVNSTHISHQIDDPHVTISVNDHSGNKAQAEMKMNMDFGGMMNMPGVEMHGTYKETHNGVVTKQSKF